MVNQKLPLVFLSRRTRKILVELWFAFLLHEDCDRLQGFSFTDFRSRYIPRLRFRIILKRVRVDSRVLQMPKIRYSKRFDYLRVRAILFLLCMNARAECKISRTSLLKYCGTLVCGEFYNSCKILSLTQKKDQVLNLFFSDLQYEIICFELVVT